MVMDREWWNGRQQPPLLGQLNIIPLDPFQQGLDIGLVVKKSRHNQLHSILLGQINTMLSHVLMIIIKPNHLGLEQVINRKTFRNNKCQAQVPMILRDRNIILVT